MDIVCPYCGVAHAVAQSFCNGCGSALPASGLNNDTQATSSRRKLLAAVAAIAAVTIVVLVVASRLSGPQQVEIVNLPTSTEAQLSATMSSTAAQQKYVITAKLSAAYAAIQPLRMMLSNYRIMEGSYPADFTEMRIDPTELTDGEYVTGVSLQPGGVLVANLEPAVFGTNAVLKLAPTDVMAGTRTRWDCTTSVPEEDRVGAPVGLACSFDPDLRS